MHRSFVQGDAQPDPGILDKILVQFGKSVNRRTDQADDKTGFVHGSTARRQQGEPAVSLLLDFRGVGWHVRLPECELKDVRESLLRRVLASRPPPAVVLDVTGND